MGYYILIAVLCERNDRDEYIFMNIPHYDELVHELAEICGILPEYWDIFGKKHITSVDTKKSVLRAMKISIDSSEDLISEIHRRKWSLWTGFVAPVHVLSEKAAPLSVPVYIPVREGQESGLSIVWSLEDETGRTAQYTIDGAEINVSQQQWIDGIRYIRTNLAIEHNGIGYYTLHVECRHPEKGFFGTPGRLQKHSKVIITPDACYIPPELEKGRAWGLSVNLYAVRSERNWGIGDFSDLKKITEWIGGLQGTLVGINPLHALQNTEPHGISPYSPLSRLYKNFIYLDVEKIPEVKELSDEQKIPISERFREELDIMRRQDIVHYEKVAALKEKILRDAFGIFYAKYFSGDTGRGNEFRKFVREEGDALESFALFMTLWEQMKKTEKAYSWQEWPERYCALSASEAAALKMEKKKEILFFKYVQWLIDCQLREIAEDAAFPGTGAGLYYDLAIGAVGGGSDAWCYQDVIATGADVGAPPDDFSPDGQKWGFPPLIPDKIKDTGYELFIRTMQKNMKYGRAIRIDHALGMFRLFWIPEGVFPKHGAYVTYPHEDLLRIIALESVRNRTMVIAEDLGTVGANVREVLKRFRMLSYRLFYFERKYPDPEFLPPGKYPEMALCAVTTHDLPTIYGYWKGRDIEVRKALEKYPNEATWRKQVRDRERDKGLILKALKSQSLLPEGIPEDPEMVPEMTPELCLAIYRFLALAPCKFLLVSLDDIIGTLNQQNMPGTVDTHPNWIQKTPSTLEEIMQDERFAGLSSGLKRYFR